MKKYLVAMLLALVAAATIPTIASAHWQSRMVKSDGQWWAIHYDINPAVFGVEYFASYGGFFAVPYQVQVYKSPVVPPATTTAACGTGPINPVFGQHYTMFNCGVWGQAGWRIRIKTPNYRDAAGQPFNIGYYVRDLCPNLSSPCP